MAAQPDSAMSLAELVVRKVAETFEQQPDFDLIPAKYHTSVVEQLSTSLPLALTAPQIEDEYYWERLSNDRWEECRTPAATREHGGSWKRLYLERNLQLAIEQLDTEQSGFEELMKTIALSKSYVRRLNISKLPSHLDVGVLFEHIPYLTDFTVVYGETGLGIEYERSLFGMKNADATCLAKAIKFKASFLTMLNLSSNLLDDDKLRLLVTGLLDNDTVTHIDLSHNKVADRGARALARLLGEDSVLTSLDLCDNEVHGEGGKALGRVLAHNHSLLSLNLRLNRLGDDGGRLLAEGLRTNHMLRELNVGANGMGVASARALGAALSNNTSLTWLDLSCNQQVGKDGGRLVREGLDNTSLTSIDLRQCNVGQHLEVAIAEAIKGSEHTRQLR